MRAQGRILFYLLVEDQPDKLRHTHRTRLQKNAVDARRERYVVEQKIQQIVWAVVEDEQLAVRVLPVVYPH